MDAARLQCSARPIPLEGIGLRFPHLSCVEHSLPAVGLLELHSENLFGLTPALRKRLVALRENYPFSLHGVGMSLASSDGIDPRHVRSVLSLVRSYEPTIVSEHLCWNRAGDQHVPDLLPVPMTQEALDVVCRNVEQVQDTLKRELAIENISAYLRFIGEEMSEAQFMTAMVERTGCKILLDLNNLYINQLNLGEDPQDLLSGLPAGCVAEYHLAGGTQVDGAWIDTHAAPVPEAVWRLYQAAVTRIGPRPTIVEWDQDLPSLEALVLDATRARDIQSRRWAA